MKKFVNKNNIEKSQLYILPANTLMIRIMFIAGFLFIYYLE